MSIRTKNRIATLLPLLALLLGLLPYRAAGAAQVVATVAGNFQSEIGCPDDWQPWCDNSLMSDPDGDGTYTFTVAAGGLPVGDYEYKVALNRSWDVNYPSNNLSFRIAAADNSVTFYYNSETNAGSSEVSGSRPPSTDGDIYWDGLRHDSRDTLYRVPGGAVTANTPVTLRFRTFHNDATGVTLRTYHTGLGAEKVYQMKKVAEAVSCYDSSLPYSCDYY